MSEEIEKGPGTAPKKSKKPVTEETEQEVGETAPPIDQDVEANATQPSAPASHHEIKITSTTQETPPNNLADALKFSRRRPRRRR